MLSNINLDRTNDLIHSLVVNLIQKISQFLKNYTENMPQNEFIEDIEVCFKKY